MPRPRDGLVYFIDDCLGSHELTAALRARGHTIKTLLDESRDPRGIFTDRAIDDDKWIPLIAAKGWIILSSDKRARSLFREVILHARAACFFFTGNHVTGARQAEVICKALPTIEKKCHQFARPLIGKITPSGQVQLDDICQRNGGIKRDQQNEATAT